MERKESALEKKKPTKRMCIKIILCIYILGMKPYDWASSLHVCYRRIGPIDEPIAHPLEIYLQWLVSEHGNTVQ